MNNVEVIFFTTLLIAVIAFGMYYTNEKWFFGRIPARYRKRIKKDKKSTSLGSFMFFIDIDGRWRSWSDCNYAYKDGTITIKPGLPFGWFIKAIAVPLESVEWNGSKTLYFRRREILKLEQCDVRIAIPTKVWKRVMD